MKPRLPEELEAHNVTLPIEGILFVGSEGAIMAGFFGEDPQLFAKGKRESLFADQPSPRGPWGTEGLALGRPRGFRPQKVAHSRPGVS